MAEVRLGNRTLDVPYTLTLYRVTEALYAELLSEGVRGVYDDETLTVETPPPPRQEEAARFLRELLGAYVRRRQLGAVLGPTPALQLPTGRRVMPDAFFLPGQPAPRTRSPYVAALPALVVTFHPADTKLQPLTSWQDMHYRKARVREIWDVYFEQRRLQQRVKAPKGWKYRPGPVGDPIRSATVEGFWFNPDWLWQERRPSVRACLNKILAGGRGG